MASLIWFKMLSEYKQFSKQFLREDFLSLGDILYPPDPTRNEPLSLNKVPDTPLDYRRHLSGCVCVSSSGYIDLSIVSQVCCPSHPVLIRNTIVFYVPATPTLCTQYYCILNQPTNISCLHFLLTPPPRRYSIRNNVRRPNLT